MRPPQRPEPERGTVTPGYDIEPYCSGHLPDTALASLSTSMGRECIGESALVRCMRHRGNPGRYARSPIRALRRNGTSPGTIRNHRGRPHTVSPLDQLSSGPGGSCRLLSTHRAIEIPHTVSVTLPGHLTVFPEGSLRGREAPEAISKTASRMFLLYGWNLRLLRPHQGLAMTPWGRDACRCSYTVSGG